MSSGCERLVNLTSDIALETPNDLALGLSLSGAAGSVALSALIISKAAHDDPPESAVALAIAATVEAMTIRFA